MRPTAQTRVFALLGNPVQHSLSPRMHNAAFLAAGIDAVYVALAVDEAALATTARTLAQNGGGGNVTIPYKRAAAHLGGRASERVQALGIANVFGGDAAEGVAWDNTDVDGVMAAHAAVGAPAGAWLVLGTGGSARAVVGAARERGVSVGVRSRTRANADAFTAWVGSIGVDVVPESECVVAVNATPLGLNPDDPLPVEPALLSHCRAVIDLTYRREGESRWTVACRKQGLEAIDGREVLLVQGAASWRLWFPDRTPPLETMRAALDGRLD